MKIALAQINLHVGNFTHNIERTTQAIHEARKQEADLIVFPEMTVCGYPAKDLLLSDSFIIQCRKAIDTIASECKGIAAIVGAPAVNTDSGGKPLYNAAYLLEEGQIRHVYHKGLLPDYDVFDEYRYFEPANEFHTIDYKGHRLALTVCEDLWNIDGMGMYAMNPPEVLAKENPEVVINISASPFAWAHQPERMRILSENARIFGCPLFSSNLVGGQADLLFDGSSAVVNQNGQLVDILPPFREALRVYDLDEVRQNPGFPIPAPPVEEEKWQLIFDALVTGVRDYFNKTGLKKALIGLSGGIDSAVTLAIAVDALGKENVWAVLLPGPHSSKHSVDDAIALARNLDVRHDIIHIDDTVNSFEQALSHHFEGTDRGVAEENIQARARAVILMGLSNKFGYLLLNTSNKSEAAVGYGTLYGDMCGGLSVLGDVYKTDVYGLARLINSQQTYIPQNTMEKPPSAELKPDQKDSDSLPDYDWLDEVLYQFIELHMDPQAIIKGGKDETLVNKVIRMVRVNEHKRFQSPPILRVSAKCLGIGRDMPLEASYKDF